MSVANGIGLPHLLLGYPLTIG